MLSYSDASAAQSDDMTEILENYYNFCAAEIYTMDGTKLYSYNENEPVFCASVIKLPYAVFVCQEITAGRMSLDDTFTYSYYWEYDGSGIIKDSAYGTDYTIRELLDYMLRYSDNIAYNVLVDLFGRDGFNMMVKEWGFDVKLSDESPRWPDVNAEFLCEAMKQMYLHSGDGECWETAWDALLNSTRGITREFNGSDDIPVAVKYGKEEFQVYHEVCYVDSETPYIFVILSEIDYDYTDYYFISRAAECADFIVREYAEEQAKKLPSENTEAVSVIKSDTETAFSLFTLRSCILRPELCKLFRTLSMDADHDGCLNVRDYIFVRYARYSYNTD